MCPTHRPSHRTLPSASPDASVLPSAESARALSTAPWPASTRRQARVPNDHTLHAWVHAAQAGCSAGRQTVILWQL